jgi:2-polyprenyl-3-methyl-5-hydroxy-6-metoxy-1,4-benzoquinol methylase
MPAPVQFQQPSPALFFETINAYQRTESLKAAIELDVFTNLAGGAQAVQTLAEKCKTSVRGMRILCDYLVVIGFLTKEQNLYSLTPDSAMFLDRRSPAYIGTSLTFLNSPMLTDGFKNLAAAVKKGGTVVGEDGTLAPEHPIWVEFARSMAPLMTLPAELIAKLVGADSGAKWKILDIAAGHGMFGIVMGKHNPNAEIVAVDWANVLELAKENARRAGLINRYKALPGSAFEVEYGHDYDLILLTNFLHHFDVASCERLLRKVYAALKTGGRAVTFEFIPNEDRVSPPVAASFAMMMLGTTPTGDAYTFSEYEQMFRRVGFTSSEMHPLPPTFQQIVISQK